MFPTTRGRNEATRQPVITWMFSSSLSLTDAVEAAQQPGRRPPFHGAELAKCHPELAPLEPIWFRIAAVVMKLARALL